MNLFFKTVCISIPNFTKDNHTLAPIVGIRLGGDEKRENGLQRSLNLSLLLFQIGQKVTNDADNWQVRTHMIDVLNGRVIG